MAIPEDRETRLRCYRNALRNWNFQGYVRFKSGSEKRLASELPGISLRELGQILHCHVEDGGEIDEQKERRPEFVADEFHFDLRVKIGERRFYFETILVCEDADDPDDPFIIIVSVRDA